MAKKSAALPDPQIGQAEDGTWTLEIPGICVSSGHPAPEWAMAAAVSDVRSAATGIVRRWIAGKSVSDVEQQVVLVVTKGDSQVYAWLENTLAEDSKRSR